MGRDTGASGGKSLRSDFGGFWTEAKLGILRKYLAAFTSASQKAGATVYLDLFAGRLWNRRPDTQAVYRGSTGVALDTVPQLSRLVFWELPSYASELQRELWRNYMRDRRWSVVPGDCNTTLKHGLAKVSDLQWAPTFAFLDPKGLDVRWETLKTLATWRRGKTKTELWVLFPEPALERVLGLSGTFGRDTARQLTDLYGCDDWLGIHQRRMQNDLSPEEARAEYVNLFRWRLQSVLGYRWTQPLGLSNVSGHPVYTMVFATDHPTGNKIMTDIYTHAGVQEIPELHARALAARTRNRLEDKGISRLFEITPVVAPTLVRHVQPWKPPEVLTGPLSVHWDHDPDNT